MNGEHCQINQCYNGRIDTRLFLHDGETLLCSQRSTAAMLLQSWLRGLLDALILTIAVCGGLFAVVFFAFEASIPLLVYAVLALLCLVLICWLRWRVWAHALFRITTERILVQPPGSLFHPPLRTIKWSQYQEGSVGHRTFFDFFFRSRPIHIRHGTADAHLETFYPSLRYAQDLKHYLDKVDSAVRRNDAASLRPFVAKPRGHRDEQLASA